MTARRQGVVQGHSDQAAADHHYPQPPRPDPLPLRALRSGTLASVLSTVAVSIFSRRHCGAVAAGTNSASQWFWYPRARHVGRPSLVYTLAGYAIHHASSLLWSSVYEATRPQQAPASGRIARAAGVSVLAYVVDYHVVPRRLSPGFEHRIGAAGMWAAYTAFGVGLLLATRIAARPASRRTALTGPVRPRPAGRARAARSQGR